MHPSVDLHEGLVDQHGYGGSIDCGDCDRNFAWEHSLTSDFATNENLINLCHGHHPSELTMPVALVA
jgi:hypothetical protein